MKFRIKLLLILMTGLAIGTWSCENDPSLLDNNVGTWKMTELRTVTYENGVQVSDISQNDSLPTWELERIGRGVSTDYSAVQDTFIWELHAEEERMIIYFRVGPFMNAALLENKLDQKLLYWENEFAEGPVLMKTQKTARIVRP